MPSLLRFGSSGPEVVELQKALNLAGKSRSPELADDGQFGPKTHGRVVEFQQANRLVGDGLVGNLTRQALKEYFDLIPKLVEKLIPPPGEAAARERVADVANQFYQQLGWRIGTDQVGPNNLRIAANLCADENTRLRQGGVALSTIFSVCGVTSPPPMRCLTIDPTAVANYALGAEGRNNWDIVSWCGIFALSIYRTVGLKMSCWPKQQVEHYGKDFKPVKSAADVKRGDMGIYNWRDKKPPLPRG